MNIENKIRYKAIGMYVVTGIIVLLSLILFYELRAGISTQKDDIEFQRNTLRMSSDLMYLVGQAQSTANLYITYQDESDLKQLSKQINQIDSLTDILARFIPSEKESLQQISRLMTNRSKSIVNLSRQLKMDIPIAEISKRIDSYQPASNENIRVVSTKRDTIYTAPQKKSFGKRVKEVFSPAKDSTVVISREFIDTLKVQQADSLLILTEVDQMAKVAGDRYEKNIRAIETQVAQMINDDFQISNRISDLLLELHERTLNSVFTSIASHEKEIKRNYFISIFGGVIALALILVFILLIIHDVNKGKEAREHLRRVMESRHQLLLSVSHDIKSPLSSIIGYLELNKIQNDNHKPIKNAVNHIMVLLENLLGFSSLEQGTQQISKSTFSLQKLAEETYQLFSPLTIQKKLQFTYESDNYYVCSDPTKIKQIIFNLVSNAIKYTPVGNVFFTLKFYENQIEITVTDTGTGIPDNRIDDLYKPFVRVENSSPLANGTGLGLYVVKGLIDLLGGTLQLESTLHKGSQFTVKIPAEKSELSLPKGTKKIAVYDDDPMVLDTTIRLLRQLGHQVEMENYDLILTDMDMGEISGLDMLAQAKNEVPVIVMTGAVGFTREKALSLGFDDFLAKPFTLDDLKAVFGEGDSFLDDFLGDDKEEILEIFRSATADNFLLLKEALAENNFGKAQHLCHKMLPTFAQLGYPTEALKRMDMSRGNEYQDWRTDVGQILQIII